MSSREAVSPREISEILTHLKDLESRLIIRGRQIAELRDRIKGLETRISSLEETQELAKSS